MAEQLTTPETGLPKISVLELDAIDVEMHNQAEIERLAVELSAKDPDFTKWLLQKAEREEGSTETPQQIIIRLGLTFGDYIYRQEQTLSLEAQMGSITTAEEISI